MKITRITRQQLLEHLEKLREENYHLRNENNVMKTALFSIYSMSKRASGIEAAIAEREEQKQKLKKQRK